MRIHFKVAGGTDWNVESVTDHENPTPQKSAFPPSGHLDLESAVTAQNDSSSLDSSYSTFLNVKT